MSTTNTQPKEEPHSPAPCVEAGTGLTPLQAARSADLMRKETRMSDQWETFCDVGYYHMWRLRRKTERGWNDGFHINTRDEAKGLCELLNKLDRELDEAKEQCSNLDDQVSSAIMVIRGFERERDEAKSEIEKLKEELESHAWTISPAMAQAKIDELCEQRDKAMCELEMWKDGNIMHEDHKNEIQELEQQRDRLAEAMRIIMADYRLDGRVSAEADMLAREALAAVEGGQL